MTKTLNANNERNVALGEQTLGAIDWQNQELDKPTKMIEQTRNKALMKPDLSNEAAEETQDKGLTEDKLDNHDNNDNHDNHDNHENHSCNSSNNLIERLELLKLESKAGHDGLHDETLNISKQLLSMNIINQEQLHNFVFNYGK